MKRIHLVIVKLIVVCRAVLTVCRRLTKRLLPRLPRPHSARTAAKNALIITGAFSVIGLIAVGAWCLCLLASLPPAELEKGVAIYDRTDKLICRAYDEERLVEPVQLKQVSKWVSQSILTSEDKGFYEHHGVSGAGVMRAFLTNLSEQRVVQGGSTITQQLSKNMFFSKEGRRLSRKIKDAAMAVALENKYSKEQILEAYLNTTYFGTGAYGIERAAKTYFGKPASNLTLAESAFLASLINAPSRLSTRANRDDAKANQVRLLKEMREDKKITDKELAVALKQKLVFRSGAYTPPHAFYVKEVLKKLSSSYDEKTLYDKGLNVFTHMDSAAQKLASAKLSRGIKGAPAGVKEGALVSLNVADGGVLAIVGGVEQRGSQWNRALSPHMAGSAIKPFVYLSGLTTGKLKPDSILLDAPFSHMDAGFSNYNPQNFDGRYLGWITTRKAIALSRNTCAVRVAIEVTPQEVIATARKAGINAQMDATPSIALGSCSVTPLEMASAYSTLARGGESIEPQLIRRIEDNKHKILQTYSAEPRRVFDAEPVAQIVDALQDVVEEGTGTRARLQDRPAAGKTGTSDGPTDIWFVGFTGDVVTAVWGGNDEFKPIGGTHVTGGTIAARIWQDYMASYYRAHPGSPIKPFPAPMEPLLRDDTVPGMYEIAPPIIDEVVDSLGRHIVREYGSSDDRNFDRFDRSDRFGRSFDDEDHYEEDQHKASAPRPKLFRKILNFIKSL